MNGQAIMVVLGKERWTQQAMHLACTVARDTNMLVVAVKMVRVNHPLLLGDAGGLVNYSEEDHRLLQNCAATAEDYGVAFQLHIFAFANYVTGLASAVEQFAALAVFAPPMSGSYALWNRFMLWRLRRAAKRPFYTLETPADQPVAMLGESKRTHLSDADFSPIAHPAEPWHG